MFLIVNNRNISSEFSSGYFIIIFFLFSTINTVGKLHIILRSGVIRLKGMHIKGPEREYNG